MRHLLCAVTACAMLSIWPATCSAQEKRFDWSRAEDPAVISWVTGTAEWHSLEPYDIGRLAGRMQKGGEQARPALRQIITHALKLNHAALGAYTCDHLLSLSRAISGELTADEKVRWRGMLEKLFNDRLAEMKWREAGVSADVLIVSGDETGNKLVAEWAVRSANLAALGTTDLQGVVGRLRTAGEKAVAGRAAVIDLVERKFLADKQSAVAVGHVGLGNLIPLIAGELAQDRRDAWAGRIESCFVDVPTNRQFVTGMLTALGHEKAARDLNRKWVEAFTNWQEMSPESLKWLLYGLVAGKDQTRAARLKIAEHIESKYLADAKSAAAVATDLWASYVQFVGQDLSAESRGKWAEAIRQAHAGSPEPAVAGQLAAALKGLGATEASNQARIKWVLESQEWKSHAPATLVALAGEMARLEDAGRPARDVLAKHVTATVLSDKTKTFEFAPSNLASVSASLAASLSAEDKQAWLSGLKAAFVDDRPALSGLNSGDFGHVLAAARALGFDQAAAWEPLWVSHSSAWQQFTPHGQVQLARRLKDSGDAAAAKAGRVRMAEHYTAALADGERARELGLETFKQLAEALLGELPNAARQQWAGQMRKTFLVVGPSLDAMRARDVVILADGLKVLGDPAAAEVWSVWVEKRANFDGVATTELTGAATILAGLGDGGKAGRARLVRHLHDVSKSDDAAVRAIGMSNWHSFISSLKEDLPEPIRAELARRLTAAFADSVKDRQTLGWALAALQQQAAVKDMDRKWVEESTTWQSLPPEGLASLARGLAAAGEPAGQARSKLVEHLTTKYVKDKASAGEVTLETWSSLIQSLHKDMPAQTKAAWAGLLQEVYGQSGDTAGKLASLMRTLEASAAADQARIKWVIESEQWKTQTPAQLVALIRDLAGMGEPARKARESIRDHLSQAYLSAERQPTSARNVSTGEWVDLVAALSSELADKDRQAWRAGLAKAFVADSAALGELSPGEVRSLADAFRLLGEDPVAAVWQPWVDKTAPFSSRPLADLSGTLAVLSGMGEPAAAVRRKAVEQVQGRYMADKSAIKSATIDAWAQCVRSLNRELSNDSQKQWAAALQDAFSQSGPEDLRQLASLLRSLGVGDAADQARARWVLESNEWKSYKLDALVLLARELAGMGDHARPARNAVAAHAATGYLVNAARAAEVTVPQWSSLAPSLSLEARLKLVQYADAWIKDEAYAVKVGLGEWQQFIAVVGGDLSAETKLAWANGLVAVFRTKGPSARAALKPILARLDQPQMAKNLELHWVQQTTDWQGLPSTELTSLARNLAGLAEPAMPARTKIAEFIAGRYLKDDVSVKSISPSEWAQIADALKKDMPPQTRRQWAARIKAAYLESADVAVLQDMIAVMSHLDDAESAGQFRGRWAAAAAEWKNWTPIRLVNLAVELGSDMASSKAARALLAEHVKTNLLANNVAIQELGVDHVSRLIRALADQVRPEDRPVWLAAVRKAFADDPAWLAAASHGDCQAAAGTLKTLGDPEAERLEAQWVLKSSKWQAMGWYQWVQLCGRLDAMGESGKAARGTVVKSLTAVYLSDAQKAKEMTLSGWHSAVNALLKDIAAEQRPEWIARLRSVFAGSPSSLDLMKHRDVDILVATLKLLGDAKAEDVWPLWVETSTVWTGTDASGIASLGGMLSKQAAAGAAARVKLIDHLNKQYLTDIAKVRASGMSFWSNLANQLVEDMTTESKVLWANRLQEAFANYSRPGDTMTQSQLLWTLRQLQSR